MRARPSLRHEGPPWLWRLVMFYFCSIKAESQRAGVAATAVAPLMACTIKEKRDGEAQATHTSPVARNAFEGTWPSTARPASPRHARHGHVHDTRRADDTRGQR